MCADSPRFALRSPKFGAAPILARGLKCRPRCIPGLNSRSVVSDRSRNVSPLQHDQREISVLSLQTQSTRTSEISLSDLDRDHGPTFRRGFTTREVPWTPLLRRRKDLNRYEGSSAWEAAAKTGSARSRSRSG